MSKERVLITVKTYPTISRKYGETVCTAGVRADGSWVRIYPVPFRRLDESEQYKKYDWLECDLIPARSDPRPESRNPVDPGQLHPVSHMDTADNWRERRRLLLNTAKVYSSMGELIEGAKANQLSLAVFKPARVKDFVCEAEDREWNADKVAELRARAQQVDMFGEEIWRETFKLIPKLPYSFSYRFEDTDGRISKLHILDWEIGALYWKCLRSCGNNEEDAIQLVRAKYLDEFSKRDLHLFLGTTQQFHQFGKNPWVIIGVFPVPHERQISLF
ncbi:MAG TPA: hypothetical protein VG962_11785 [Steroidobacteraceae bacterium]|nr:hypothetical protein [Steroidobacteraceae bacterium]